MNAANDAAPPPAYSFRPVNSLSRMNRRPLRGSVGAFCIAGTIFASIWAGYNWKYYGGDSIHGLKITDLIIAVLFTVVAIFQAYGLFACWKGTRPLIRTFGYLSIASLVLASGGVILAFIQNFAFKSALLNACEEAATSDGVTLRSGWWWDDASEQRLSQVEAVVYCRDRWKRGIWGDVILVVVVIFLASLASLFAVAHSRQMAAAGYDGGVQLDSAQGVPLSTYESRLPDYVPEYPGPPATGPPVEDNKHFLAHSAEDAAWQQSLTESERREWDEHHADERAQQQHRGGGPGTFNEEDEAWERARNEGSTAHFTAGQSNPWGQGVGARGRRRSDDDEGHAV